MNSGSETRGEPPYPCVSVIGMPRYPRISKTSESACGLCPGRPERATVLWRLPAAASQMLPQI
jgi:hypothetical protein